MTLDPGQTYSSSDVCEAIGLSYRVLDYWARTDVLVPSIAAANGSGSKRRYSERDLRVARILNVLRQLGADTTVLGAVARQTLAAEQLESGRLMVSPAGVVTADLELAATWPCWWVVSLDMVLPGRDTDAEADVAA